MLFKNFENTQIVKKYTVKIAQLNFGKNQRVQKVKDVVKMLCENRFNKYSYISVCLIIETFPWTLKMKTKYIY